MHGYSSDPKDQELGLYKGFGGFSALQIGTLEVSPIRKFKKTFLMLNKKCRFDFNNFCLCENFTIVIVVVFFVYLYHNRTKELECRKN